MHFEAPLARTHAVLAISVTSISLQKRHRSILAEHECTCVCRDNLSHVHLT